MQRYEIAIRYFGPVSEIRTIEAINESEARGYAEKIADGFPVTIRLVSEKVA